MKALEIIKAIPVQIKLLFIYPFMCYVSPSWPQTQIHTQQELSPHTSRKYWSTNFP